MLIAITGSQGSGKSTMLDAISATGYSTIARKTSRSILSDWDVTLDEVNDDHKLTTKFQDEITKRKWDDEMDAVSSSSVIFTERSHMDLFTYALITLGKNNEYSNWLNEYYNKCYAYSQSCTHAFFLRSGCFPVVGDGVRGVNMHYSDMVDTLMLHYTKSAFNKKHTIVTGCTKSARLDTILQVH